VKNGTCLSTILIGSKSFVKRLLPKDTEAGVLIRTSWFCTLHKIAVLTQPGKERRQLVTTPWAERYTQRFLFSIIRALTSPQNKLGVVCIWRHSKRVICRQIYIYISLVMSTTQDSSQDRTVTAFVLTIRLWLLRPKCFICLPKDRT